MILKHYDAEVIMQTTEDDFTDTLKQKGISYSILPIVDLKVVRYHKDGRYKYAVIEKNSVYITETIPEDMSWRNLVNDCNAQKNGEEPERLPTRARILYDKVVEHLKSVHTKEMDMKKDDAFLDWLDWEPTGRDIDCALMTFGSSLKELLKEDHYDTEELDDRFELDGSQTGWHEKK